MTRHLSLTLHLTSLVIIIQANVFGAIVKRNAAADQSCSYNINVLATGEACPSGASAAALNQLQASISAQHANLENKLTTLLGALGHNHGGAASGNGTSAGGVNYKRWGRTTCPATASLVYEGIALCFKIV